jgi:xanthine dehydrogenase, molybdenum binding subunit apoprotein (EC 1.17.1.4)
VRGQGSGLAIDIKEIAVGTYSHGQGHATVYAQIAADELGIPIEG